MNAARPLHNLTRGFGRNAFDMPVAALAALAVAFVAFAMPADLLGRLVSTTGLPHLLAAAEPPLGLKARGGIGFVGAIAAFGFVLMTMRMLDRSARKRPRPEPEASVAEEERPRLRRRDLHPDAPICRPISAIRDFGEPAPPPMEPVRASEPAGEGFPTWLAEAEPDEGELELVPEREPEPRAATSTIEPRIEAAPLAAEPAAEASLPDLMRRLEQGLARRRTRQIFAPTQQQAPSPQVFPEANDDRLQSAIESLQRFAARGE